VTIQSGESWMHLSDELMHVLLGRPDLITDHLANELRMFNGGAFKSLTAIKEKVGLEVNVSLPLLRSKL